MAPGFSKDAILNAKQPEYIIGWGLHPYDWVKCDSQRYDGSLPWWRKHCDICGRTGHTDKHCGYRRDAVGAFCSICTKFSHHVRDCKILAAHFVRLKAAKYIPQNYDTTNPICLINDCHEEYHPGSGVWYFDFVYGTTAIPKAGVTPPHRLLLSKGSSMCVPRNRLLNLMQQNNFHGNNRPQLEPQFPFGTANGSDKKKSQNEKKTYRCIEPNTVQPKPVANNTKIESSAIGQYTKYTGTTPKIRSNFSMTSIQSNPTDVSSGVQSVLSNDPVFNGSKLAPPAQAEVDEFMGLGDAIAEILISQEKLAKFMNTLNERMKRNENKLFDQENDRYKKNFNVIIVNKV